MHGQTEIAPGIADAAWFDEAGRGLTPEAWADGTAQLLALRRAAPQGGGIDVTLLLLNATGQEREFAFPRPELSWEIELDSSKPEQQAANAAPPGVLVGAHGAMLLAASVPA